VAKWEKRRQEYIKAESVLRSFAVHVSAWKTLVQKVVHLSGRERVLSVRENKGAGRICVNIEGKFAAPDAIKRVPGKHNFGFGINVVDDAKFLFMHIERIRRPEDFKAEALALVMDLQQKMEDIGQGKP